jgi:hypothetical protein
VIESFLLPFLSDEDSVHFFEMFPRNPLFLGNFIGLCYMSVFTFPSSINSTAQVTFAFCYHNFCLVFLFFFPANENSSTCTFPIIGNCFEDFIASHTFYINNQWSFELFHSVLLLGLIILIGLYKSFQRQSLKSQDKSFKVKRCCQY